MVALCQGWTTVTGSFFCFRYLYYFLKSENAHTKELLNVLEGLLRVDPTSELNEEYCMLATHKTGKWISLISLS